MRTRAWQAAEKVFRSLLPLGNLPRERERT
jgi:hypothetical protein